MRLSLFDGYLVPHFIHGCSLSASEQFVIVVLYKLRDDYVKRVGRDTGYFFSSNDEILSIAKVAPRSLRRIKFRLKITGLIDFSSGSKATRGLTRYVLLDKAERTNVPLSKT